MILPQCMICAEGTKYCHGVLLLAVTADCYCLVLLFGLTVWYHCLVSLLGVAGNGVMHGVILLVTG